MNLAKKQEPSYQNEREHKTLIDVKPSYRQLFCLSKKSALISPIHLQIVDFHCRNYHYRTLEAQSQVEEGLAVRCTNPVVGPGVHILGTNVSSIVNSNSNHRLNLFLYLHYYYAVKSNHLP